MLVFVVLKPITLHYIYSVNRKQLCRLQYAQISKHILNHGGFGHENVMI